MSIVIPFLPISRVLESVLGARAFRVTFGFLRRLSYYDPAKRRELLAKQLSVRPQKTWVFSNTAVRTSLS
jgi:hypothetical protein